MKNLLIFLCTIVLFSCASKNKKGAPLDETDSHYVAPATDSAKTDAALHDDTSVAYLARVRGNQKPVANAGANQKITTSDLTLNGSASKDPDGTIYKWLWTQEKGSLVNILNDTSKIATVKNLPAGEYRFRLTVTDRLLATGTDTIHVSKSGVIVTPPPVDTTVVTPPSGTRANLIFQTTWEESNPWTSYYDPTQSCCPYSLTASTEQSRFPGGKSLRVELYRTDADVAGSKRAEVYPKVNDGQGVDRWLGISYYFPSQFMQSDADYDLIAQWHPNSGTGSPPFSLRLLKGQWQVAQITSNSFSAQAFQWYPLGPYKMDIWNDVVIHYKQSSGSDGLTEVWINGNKVWTKSGASAFAGYSNYLKIGDNKSPWMPGASWGGTKNHVIFYIDQIRYGNEKATYNDVNPSVQ